MIIECTSDSFVLKRRCSDSSATYENCPFIIKSLSVSFQQMAVVILTCALEIIHEKQENHVCFNFLGRPNIVCLYGR